MSTMPLWKRCRILANPLRLKMLIVLAGSPRQYVKSVGEQLGLSEDVACKNLQLLASGGFLTAERVGRYLYYSLGGSDALLHAVLGELRRARGDAGFVIRTLTALTHERRVAMIAVLRNEPVDSDVLCRRVRMSGLAAGRHLDKLVRRGWVSMDGDLCRVLFPETPLEQVLLEAVKQSVTLAQV
jgi:DNA-binding transcriptional ArsR family regulator